jgi:hypothetical protein
MKRKGAILIDALTADAIATGKQMNAGTEEKK